KYQEIFFTEREEGILVNTNDFTLEGSIKNLFVLNTAAIKNIGFKFSLLNGKLVTDYFHASGFNAQYNFSVDSNLNFYWPKIEYAFTVSGLDLQMFAADAHLRGNYAGLISMEESYKSDFYKMSQLLENAKYSYTVKGEKLELNGTDIQRKADELIRDSQISTDISSLSIQNFEYNYRFVFQEKSIGALYVNSDKFNFSVRAKIDSDDFSTPVKINFPQDKSVLKVKLIFNTGDDFPYLYNEEQDSSFYMKDIFH
ncbi:MAG: hypothetical protein JW982_05790, partial [Spirochaetes bacterium]|nr:hypothetical protein [Spirochaetota bacterium]